MTLFSSLTLSQNEGDGDAATPKTHPYIFVADADGSSIVPLFHGLHPRWAPPADWPTQGPHILFHTPSQEFRRGQMHIIDSDRSGGLWVGPGIEATWSPDARQIAYVNDEGIALWDLREWLRSSRVANPTTIIRHDFLTGLAFSEGGTDVASDMGIGKAAWSPDGSQIAFEHLGDGEFTPAQIFLMDADGNGVQRLSPSLAVRYAESDPAWSPDGSSIAFWSYDHGLAVMQLASRSVRTLHKDFPRVSYGASPAWSPDGSTIAFVVRDEHSGEPAIWLVESAGGIPQEFIPNAYDPAWSSDGNQIAFVSDLPGPVPRPVFPPVTDALSIYTRETPHLWPMDGESRYVLYANGRFEFQYLRPDGEIWPYSGIFVSSGSDIVFNFSNWYTTWQSFGSLREDGSTLLVRYDETMSLSDFEDGAYVLDVQNPEEPADPEEPTDPEGPVKEPDEPRDPPIPLPPETECPPECFPDDDPDIPVRGTRN